MHDTDTLPTDTTTAPAARPPAETRRRDLPRPDASARGLRARNERRCERLLARAGLLDTTGIRWEDAAAVELDGDTVATLVYMRDVEGFTTRDLAGLAAHPATLADPLIRRFLAGWQAEEHEHARALDRFLRAYAEGRDVEVPAQQPPPPAAPGVTEQLTVTATRPVGHVVATAHMAWGAVNELLTLNGYRLLAHRCGHPVLADLLTRIAAQESRHYGFYALQAEWRLASSRLARRLVPALLRRTWTPVGVGDDFKSPAEFDRVLLHLAGSTDGDRAIAAMDRTLGRLPGFGDLHLYRVAARAAHRRGSPAAA